MAEDEEHPIQMEITIDSILQSRLPDIDVDVPPPPPDPDN
jgi:hypothetical protein